MNKPINDTEKNPQRGYIIIILNGVGPYQDFEEFILHASSIYEAVNKSMEWIDEHYPDLDMKQVQHIRSELHKNKSIEIFDIPLSISITADDTHSEKKMQPPHSLNGK